MASNTEIICPHCHKAFTVNESEYASLLNQVSKQEIAREVHEKLSLATREKADAVKIAKAEALSDFQKTLSDKDSEIISLKSELSKAKTEQDLAVMKAISKAEKERDDFKNQLKTKDAEKSALELSLKDKYESAIKFKDEEIERLKDMKMRLSTKMVGETLEQHCETEFNKLRPTAFQNAYFEKDNAVSKACLLYTSDAADD